MFVDVTMDNKNYWLLDIYLVGGWKTILKNMKVNGKDDILYIMENKTCLKQAVLQLRVL